ncbi:MAG: reverse transcriptase family protein [Pseudomonadota bacterium]
MSRKTHIAHELAAHLLSGAWSRRQLQARALSYLGKQAPKARKQLIDDVLAAQSTAYPPSPRNLARTLLQCPTFNRAASHLLKQSLPLPAVLQSPKFAPIPAFQGLAAPPVATPGELAEWLGISIEQLDWLADSKRQHGRTNIPILHNYAYRLVPKASGQSRLIEAPKARLKALQRRILRDILDLAPVHLAAHGFVRGRSCISGASVHAGEAVVACLDLKDFFSSISAARVHGLFRSFGYPWAVARLLTGLCTTSTPHSVFTRLPEEARPDWTTRKTLEAPHLPQGASTSPALANLCAWRLDQRLAALGRAVGANYTRYADDLTFSGDSTFGRRVDRVITLVQTIVREEGFRINARKTRVMRSAGRQCVTGVIVNERVNVERTSYDTLKAVLHNCRRHGPTHENRAGHAAFRAQLDGRVNWVEQLHPERGAKLRRAFEAIDWTK